MNRRWVPLLFVLGILGCQDQTGYENLDPIIVKNYDDRVALTWLIKDSVSYCKFGCYDICSMSPEPTIKLPIYNDIERNDEKFEELRKRTENGGFLLDLKRKKVVFSQMKSRVLSDDQIPSEVKKCIEKQSIALEKAEEIIERLEK